MGNDFVTTEPTPTIVLSPNFTPHYYAVGPDKTIISYFDNTKTIRITYL